jgi:hypothetical protein
MMVDDQLVEINRNASLSGIAVIGEYPVIPVDRLLGLSSISSNMER